MTPRIRHLTAFIKCLLWHRGHKTQHSHVGSDLAYCERCFCWLDRRRLAYCSTCGRPRIAELYQDPYSREHNPLGQDVHLHDLTLADNDLFKDKAWPKLCGKPREHENTYRFRP